MEVKIPSRQQQCVICWSWLPHKQPLCESNTKWQLECVWNLTELMPTTNEVHITTVMLTRCGKFRYVDIWCEVVMDQQQRIRLSILYFHQVFGNGQWWLASEGRRRSSYYMPSNMELELTWKPLCINLWNAGNSLSRSNTPFHYRQDVRYDKTIELASMCMACVPKISKEQLMITPIFFGNCIL